MSYVKIDFSSESHKASIMTLCKEYDFYVNEIHANLYVDDPDNLPDMHGYLIVVRDTTEKWKVIAFVLFNTKVEEDKVVGELLFRFVDEKYRRQGYGNALMNRFLQDRGPLKIGRIVATVHIDYVAWYKKCGFHVDASRCPMPGSVYMQYIDVK